IRSKLKKKRKQIAGQSVVQPNAKLAAVIGAEPRTREEMVVALHEYARDEKPAEPSSYVAKNYPALHEFSLSGKAIYPKDLKRIVTLNVEPLQLYSYNISFSHLDRTGGQILAADSELDGDPMTPFRKKTFV